MRPSYPAPTVGPFTPAAGARILSFGGYQPGNVVTNDDLAAAVETSDEWIRSRVGIVSRRVAGPDESVTDMAFVAGGKALAGKPRPGCTCVQQLGRHDYEGVDMT